MSYTMSGPSSSFFSSNFDDSSIIETKNQNNYGEKYKIVKKKIKDLIKTGKKEQKKKKFECKK